MNLKARIDAILAASNNPRELTGLEAELLKLLRSFTDEEYPYITVLKFTDTEEMDTVIGGLSDGFGEGYVSLYPKQNQDTTLDWSICRVDNIDPDYMDDDDFDDGLVFGDVEFEFHYEEFDENEELGD